MATHANSLRAGAEFRICRMADPVIAMADHASGQARGLERDFVRTFLVHLVLEDMTF